MTEAVHVVLCWSASYWAVSLMLIEVSVAWVVVTTVMRRGAPGAVVQRVRHARPAPEAEWLDRESRGVCSQQEVVLQDLPAPEIRSSAPCCWIWTVPPGAPWEAGFGPQSSPHDEAAHCSETALAVHVPLRDCASCESAALDGETMSSRVMPPSRCRPTPST
ncbi:uncharacterized protein CMC5_006790 [Chondromyces crocatus]|uniref:Uncharacterized protein n=1 Tax=Chondromyces crocatus TaxID=52 RepID=A0A0K1E6S2_CHOCO|nr:uncharacterized protein CMC5_006790 [Chondromyces crocatus]